MILEGIAAPYGVLSAPRRAIDRAALGVMREAIAPRALVWGPDTYATWTHTAEMAAHGIPVAEPVPLGRVGAGTLRLWQTEDGLAMRLALPDWADDVREALRRGDLTGAVSVALAPDTDDEIVMASPFPIVLVRSGYVRHVALVRRATWPEARVRPVTEEQAA